jgi:RNA polymerase sigma factor (sigma-70 family)
METYGSLSDQELTDLLKTGDHVAFTTIYKRYWKKLVHYALQKSGDPMDAENMVQDVFVSLWKRRTELTFTGELSRYLTASVKYRVIKLFHKQHAKRLYEENALLNYDLLDDSTREQLDLVQLEEQLAHLVNALPQKAQLIYRMNKESDMSHREIGDQLGMNEKAVNTQLVRIRKTLRVGLNSFLHSFLL